MTYTYTPDDLAWYATTYADDEWMVHVTGPDDCLLRADPDLDDDDPRNPVLDQAGAVKLAAGIEKVNAWAAERYPGEEGPQLVATIFHRGVPWTPEQTTDSTPTTQGA